MLNIPPLSQEQFFWFKFKGEDEKKKRREGCLVSMTETTQPPPKLGHKKHLSFNYQNKKYHEVLQSEAHHLSWCCRCPSQSTVILIYRSQGILVREKYCDECVQKYIIKL
jgi:hypothetical protein